MHCFGSFLLQDMFLNPKYDVYCERVAYLYSVLWRRAWLWLLELFVCLSNAGSICLYRQTVRCFLSSDSRPTIAKIGWFAAMSSELLPKMKILLFLREADEQMKHLELLLTIFFWVRSIGNLWEVWQLACVAGRRKGGKSKWAREEIFSRFMRSSFLFPSPSDACHAGYLATSCEGGDEFTRETDVIDKLLIRDWFQS